MQVKFDIDVDAWIKDVFVDAESLEEAKEKLIKGHTFELFFCFF